MKIYRVIDGQLQSAELADGALPIALGATLGADGKDRHPITAIDYEKRLYWRGGGAAHDFPKRWIDEDGINALPWSDELAPKETP